MKKKYQICINVRFYSFSEKLPDQSYEFDLAGVMYRFTGEEKAVPLFDSEDKAQEWYMNLYKKENDRINAENQKRSNEHKPGIFNTDKSKVLENNLPKKIYMRECWVIE